MFMEIERKWLVSGHPVGLKKIGGSNVKQSYLSTDPEVRIRSITEQGGDIEMFYLEVKSLGELSRQETTLEIPEVIYAALLQNCGNMYLLKRTSTYQLNGSTGGELELQVSDIATGFTYAEIEFGSEEEALSYVPCPEFEAIILREITYESQYKMKNVWGMVKSIGYKSKAKRE